MSENLTVILADGDFPVHAVPVGLLKRAARVVCCDGAACALLARGREPDLIVGDLDSLPPTIKEKWTDRTVHFTEQESNDLSKAFRCCTARNWHNIIILGATGKREDHTLGNLSLLAEYAQIVPDIRMVTDHGILSVARGQQRFKAVPGQQISLIAIDPGTRVTARGLKYPLEDLALNMWWQGTLNEALEDEFFLDISPDRRLLVYHNLNGVSENFTDGFFPDRRNKTRRPPARKTLKKIFAGVY